MRETADKRRTLELLAPARDAETAIAAIMHGADAVYIGGPAFGARSAAGNSTDDIKRVVDAASPFGVRVYVTLNTILFDSEIAEAEKVIGELYAIGVDALIIQDPAILLLDIPPIDLHASTQWNSDSIEKLEMLSRAGFSQIVVPREFSLEKIRQAHEAIGDRAQLEVFVHGALCVSYSGGCHAGQALAGRSANRGCCPQICRLKFDLTDSEGKPVRLDDGGTASRHWLSLADMNRLDSLRELADAGASSFKIEGRLKPIAYVKNVTAAYSRELNDIVKSSDGRYVRSSFGKVSVKFSPDPVRVFNRGFTRYFLTEKDRRNIVSWNTPKWIGQPAAKFIAGDSRVIKASISKELHNGDGLGWFDKDGAFHGFRVNRVENDRIYPAPGSDLPSKSGTVLYRNSDSSFEQLMARGDTATRVIPVKAVLRSVADGRIALDLSDERGCYVSVVSDDSFADISRTDQTAARKNTLAKLGDTIYELESLDDFVGDVFVPLSKLSVLRRKAVEALDNDWAIRRQKRKRRSSMLSGDEFGGHIDFKANVANRLARQFYLEHGADSVDEALECRSTDKEIQVMTTDYCIRRELGACLRTKSRNKLPDNLFLAAPIGKLRLEFDCENCRMKIYTKPKL